MASLSTESDGNRKIQFKLSDDKKHSVYLGKMPVKQAQTVKIRVEALVSSHWANTSLDADTSSWLAGLTDRFYRKLAGAKLVPERQKQELPSAFDDDRSRSPNRKTAGNDDAKPGSVHHYVDEWIARWSNGKKKQTQTSMSNLTRNLKEFFSKELMLSELDEVHGEDFEAFLRDKMFLSSATIARRCSYARTIFRRAFRRKLTGCNPFDDIGKGSPANTKRRRFISHETIYEAIKACPNVEWRCLLALARFGGLRVPSETFLIRLDEIDWDQDRFFVHSPKTEHHEGKESRLVPIFPELRPYLEEAWEAAADGQEWLLQGLRNYYGVPSETKRVQVGKPFIKILERARIPVWPKVWQNLRASRETDLADHFPMHVVTAWIGNSERVAKAHYLQVTEEHYGRAVKEGKKLVQKVVQHQSASGRVRSQEHDPPGGETPCSDDSQLKTGRPEESCIDFYIHECVEELRDILKTGANSSASFRELIQLWSVLSESDRDLFLGGIRLRAEHQIMLSEPNPSKPL